MGDLSEDSFAFSSAMPRQGRRTASSVGATKRAAPTPYSGARLDANATTATPLARRAAVWLKTAADSLAAAPPHHCLHHAAAVATCERAR